MSKSESNTDTSSNSRRSSVSSNGNEYSEEELYETDAETTEEDGEQEMQETSAPSENNAAGTNGWGSTFPSRYREEMGYGDSVSYDISSDQYSSDSSSSSAFSTPSSSRRSSVSSNSSNDGFSQHYLNQMDPFG